MESGQSAPKSRHLFLSGPPRGGTTLLQIVLSAHPMVTVTPETTFIQQVFAQGNKPDRTLTPDEIESVTGLMKEDAKLRGWPAFDAEDFLAGLSPSRQMTIAELLDRLFRRYADATGGGTDYLGNKKGLYAEGYGPYAKEIFPDARFLFIVRDPRDVVRSIRENLTQRPIADAASTCSDRDHYMIEMKRLFPDDVRVVRYEDLVREPEPVCRRLCEFLDIPFDERMLTFHEANRDGSRLIAATRGMHQNTTTPFNPELIGQWKREKCFTTRELQQIEAVTRDYMTRHGYVPEAPNGGIGPAVARWKMSTRRWIRERRRRRATAVRNRGAE